MTVEISGGPGGSLNRDVTSIDNTDSPYTTAGEDILLVDTTTAAVTVTLSTADATADPESTLRIYDSGENASSNNITVNTEGSENINPGTLSSVTLSVDGTWIDLQSDGSNWFADLAPQVTSLTDNAGNTISDFTGERLSVDGSNVLNANNEVTAIDDTDSPYTTSAEDIIEVDSSGGAVTVTLASADLDAGRTILVLDDAGSASTNAITIDTEGSETIDPDGDSSKSITTDHAAFAFEANGTNWNQVNANQEVEEMVAGEIVTDAGATLEVRKDGAATGSSFNAIHVVSGTDSFLGFGGFVAVVGEDSTQERAYELWRVSASQSSTTATNMAREQGSGDGQFSVAIDYNNVHEAEHTIQVTPSADFDSNPNVTVAADILGRNITLNDET